MADTRLIHRAALAACTPVSSANISLTPLPEGHLIQLIGPDDRAQVPVPQPDCAVYANGPGQWFIVGEAPLSRAALGTFLGGLPNGAVAVDQSHGRVRVRIAGPRVERVLEKGSGVDLTGAVFPVGHSATTLIGHIAVHVARTGDASFELTVLRSFAGSLWDDLVRMSREFA